MADSLPGRCIHRYYLGTVLAAFMSLSAWAGAGDTGIWLDIDTGAETLRVMDGDQAKDVFENIAVGRYGTTSDKRAGDNKTPLGRFHIAWIKEDTRFHLFLGLDYPTQVYAYRAFRKGLVGRDVLEHVRKAFATGQTPPQQTPLGGYVGIHGIGEGDPRFHGAFNWTNGCIALTNEQIDRLRRWIHVGTAVTIH